MSKTTKIAIAVVIVLLLATGGYIYWKKQRSNDVDALKKKLSAEEYVLFQLTTGYASRNPKPADADAKVTAQQKVVLDLQNQLKALTA